MTPMTPGRTCRPFSRTSRASMEQAVASKDDPSNCLTLQIPYRNVVASIFDNTSVVAPNQGPLMASDHLVERRDTCRQLCGRPPSSKEIYSPTVQYRV
ncbi:hypothetical protein KC19_VG066500 [Ceratodon purpureus]|uniref:Uncharacterized protein n=1 Tax=Ceratodon purpureus TaxID=3225 RepID=A0A8T0HMN6_CERPU|nr:hypothetical protein KC19_VG066500 [Ceratodon purpureus]